MSLETLPAELLLWVMSHLNSIGDCNSLIQTNRRCYDILNNRLYVNAISQVNFRPLYWAASRGHTSSLRRLFEAVTPGLALASKELDIRWCHYWENPYLSDGKCKGNLFKSYPTFHYPPDYGEVFLSARSRSPSRSLRDFHFKQYYNGHRIPLVCLYRDAVVEAVIHGQIESVKLLLDEIPWSLRDISEDDPKWDIIDYIDRDRSLIDFAATYNRAEMIDFLVAKGVAITSNTKDEAPSALHIASLTGSLEALKKLIKHGANPDMVDYLGNTPLFNAMVHGHHEIARLLLDHGADPLKKSQDKFTPLWIGTFLGREQAVRALLDAGVDPNGLDSDGNLPEYIAESAVANLAEELEISCRIEDYDCSSPLCIAAFFDCEDLILLLLEYGADPNMMDRNGKLPLHIALEQGSLFSANELLRNGARVDTVDALGKNTIYYALLQNDHIPQAVKLLVAFAPSSLKEKWAFSVLEHEHSSPEAPLPPNIITHREAIAGPGSTLCGIITPASISGLDSQYTQLYEPGGFRCQCVETMQHFVDQWVSLEGRDSLGRTLLHQAAYWMCTKTTKLLIANGLDPRVQDSFGQTPLHLAVAHVPKSPDLIWIELATLLNAGGDLNCKDSNGQTPLHLAAQIGNHWAVQLMTFWITDARTKSISASADPGQSNESRIKICICGKCGYSHKLTESNELIETEQLNRPDEMSGPDEMSEPDGLSEPDELNELHVASQPDELNESDVLIEPDYLSRQGDSNASDDSESYDPDNDDSEGFEELHIYIGKLLYAEKATHERLQGDVTILDNSGSTPYNLAERSSLDHMRFNIVLCNLNPAEERCTCIAICGKTSCQRFRELVEASQRLSSPVRDSPQLN